MKRFIGEKPAPPVLIDMDDVLAGLLSSVRQILIAEFPHIEPITDGPSFYHQNDYPKEYQSTVLSIFHRPGLYANLPFIKYAVPGLQRIGALGYEKRLCSTPDKDNPTCLEDKIFWIERKLVPIFGKQILKTAIFTDKKAEVDGIALIDDRHEITNSDQATWQHVYFDASYNRGYGRDDFRLNGWLDPHLPTILAKCSYLYFSKNQLVPAHQPSLDI